VEQVLLNLLSNAITSSPTTAEVEVVSEACDGLVETSVRDTGIGIRKEDQALLFRPFQQVEVGLTAQARGHGLACHLRQAAGPSAAASASAAPTGRAAPSTFSLPRPAEARP
jgi:signal transduction histidine kinase